MPVGDSRPVLRRAKATVTHHCRAESCLYSTRTIGASTVYVAVSKRTSSHAARFFTQPFHVRCFLTEHPEHTLAQILGHERHGPDALGQLHVKTLWDHLVDQE